MATNIGVDVNLLPKQVICAPVNLLPRKLQKKKKSNSVGCLSVFRIGERLLQEPQLAYIFTVTIFISSICILLLYYKT